MGVSEKGGMVQVFASGTGSVRAGRAVLLALALQLRPAWVLLGPWLVWGGESARSLVPRLRILPAHPDWYLPALAQSCVTALTMVGLARRFRPGWALLTAALAGALAWAVTFALVPNSPEGFVVILGAMREVVAMAVILVCLRVTWTRLGPWTAVPVVASVAGVAAVAVRLLLSNTIFGARWPEDWPSEMGVEIVGVALLAIGLAVLRSLGPTTRSSIVAGTAGLLLLVLAHLAAGSWVSGWTRDDSRRLGIAAAVLALAGATALLAAAGSRWRRPS